jgi:hypothetical protein
VAQDVLFLREKIINEIISKFFLLATEILAE